MGNVISTKVTKQRQTYVCQVIRWNMLHPNKHIRVNGGSHKTFYDYISSASNHSSYGIHNSLLHRNSCSATEVEVVNPTK